MLRANLSPKLDPSDAKPIQHLRAINPINPNKCPEHLPEPKTPIQRAKLPKKVRDHLFRGYGIELRPVPRGVGQHLPF
jgi:hypothetical protein